MEAGQYIGVTSQAIGPRPKFRVSVICKDGTICSYDDAGIHHADGWLVINKYASSNDWRLAHTTGIRADQVNTYTVVPLES